MKMGASGLILPLAGILEHHQLFNFFRAGEGLYIVNVIPRLTSAAC